MKKIITLLSVFIFTLLLTGCGGSEYLKTLSYDELNQKLENKESFILEVMRTGCTACEGFAPKLESVTNDYKVTVYQLNTSDLSDEVWEEFKDKFSVSATPTIVFFTEGEELTIGTRIVGDVSKDKVIEQFKNMGYIE